MSWSYPFTDASAAALVRDSLLVGRHPSSSTDVAGGTLFATSASAPGFSAGAVCVIGVFDGFHRGHQELVRAAGEDAHRRGLPLVAVTFAPDPAEVLGKGSPRRLLSADDRVRALCVSPVDYVLRLDFSRAVASLSYEEFVLRVLWPVVRPVSVHVGSDFAMGAGRAGTVDALKALGARMGFEVCGHELVDDGGSAITATRVRGLVAAGDVRGAAGLLGRAHFVAGRVRHGRGEGTGMGFPTANVSLDSGDSLPGRGVYAGFLEQDGRAWPAAINMGEPPTFTDATDAMLEANLMGFDGDLYGSDVCVSFVEFLRPTRPFSSVKELERVVQGNIAWVQENLGDGPVEVGA